MLEVRGRKRSASYAALHGSPLGLPAATDFRTLPSSALTPSDIRTAYGFTQSDNGTGTGKTIGIVDADYDPKITADLAAFSRQFGLPACTGATGCLTQHREETVTHETSTWILETSLDVEWVHAMAPKAHILLVEAYSTANNTMFSAVTYAAGRASYVSMSWGGTEYAGESSTDSVFSSHTSSVSFFASSGDTGSEVNYPAASPDVIAVGGTQLSVTTTNGDWERESAWSAAGGGCSRYETASSAQGAFATYDQATANCDGMRAIPDVAADAAPSTGVGVYDSLATGWFQVGGTSLSAPLWAGHSAAAGVHVNATYVYGHSIPFYDVTTGATTSSKYGRHNCLTGYDLCDGLGSWNSTHGHVNTVVPARPAAPTVVDGSTKVTLTWTAPTNGGSTITGYTITSTHTGKTCTTTGSLTCTVNGLTNGATYSFRLTAKNGVGTSAPSPPTSVIPNTPLRAPSSTLGTTAHSTSVTVSWKAVTLATGYGVYKSTTSGLESYSGAPDCTTTTNSCTVTGLTPDKPYYFTVKTLHTGVMSTVPSNEVSTETVAAPTVTTHGAGTGTFSMTYQDGAGAPPSGYSVYEGSEPGTETYTHAVTGCAKTTVTTCTVNGLTTGGSYYFTVEATGSEGSGEPFVTSPSSEVFAEPIAVPSGVSTTAEAADVKVSWAAAAGATSYKVYDSTTVGAENYSGTAACTAAAPATSCTVTSLTANTKYYFTVVGVNATGTSTHSGELTATPSALTFGGGGGGGTSGGGGGTSGGGGGTSGGSGTGGSTPPPAPAPPTGTTAVKSASSSTSKGTAKVTDGAAGVTAVALGAGSLTVAKYTGTPGAVTAISTGTGKYVDVRVATGSAFSSLAVTVCGGQTTGALDWWNGSVWMAFSEQTRGSTGCVTATVTGSTSPRLAQLTGTAIATVKKSATATRISGETADATAAKELETEFAATGATGSCVGGKANAANTRPVVLATTKTFPDALAASYLASSFDTGILLTPAGRLSVVTAAALRKEGVTHVVVVGGALAVGATVVASLEATAAETCGGGSALAQHITVTRIGGATQYDTAEMIAEAVSHQFVGSASFPGAYGGQDPSGGTGAYNDTAGHSSTAPAGGLRRTAVLASGEEYQDAMAASGMAYAMKFPVLLTTPTTLSHQAADAIAALTVSQVIVMGGPFAVSNAVASQLGNLGVSVVRVAGQDATDTASELANFEAAPTGTGLAWSGKATLAVARANGFTDGLAGSVVTGKTELPLLLTETPSTIGPYLTAFLQGAGQSGDGIDGEVASRVLSLVVFGGQLAVTTAVVSAMESSLN